MFPETVEYPDAGDRRGKHRDLEDTCADDSLQVLHHRSRLAEAENGGEADPFFSGLLAPDRLAETVPERLLIHQPREGECAQALQAVAGKRDVHPAALEVEGDRISLEILEAPETDDQRLLRGDPRTGPHRDREEIGGAERPRAGGDEAVAHACGDEAVGGRKEVTEGVERLRDPRPARPGVGVIRVSPQSSP